MLLHARTHGFAQRVAAVCAEEQRKAAQPQVAVAEAAAVERVDLGVSEDVPHALDVNNQQAALGSVRWILDGYKMDRWCRQRRSAASSKARAFMKSKQ